ncbi:MAG: hypothetical protein ACRDYU_08615 [Actinomycetes bacterium]
MILPRARGLCWAGAVAAVLFTTSVSAAAASLSPVPSPPAGASVERRLSDPAIVEGSGLAASGVHPGVLYVVNDSGDSPRVFAVGRDGDTRAVLRLDGVTVDDPESLAAGPHGTLWVGDIGDNDRQRGAIAVYRVSEPAQLRDATLAVTTYRLRYPDGAHDAETLLVHPRTGRVYVVTKELLGRVYATPGRPSPDEVTRLRRVASASPVVTGGELTPDGHRLALRDLTTARVYAVQGDRLDDDALDLQGTVPLPKQPLGESVTWTPGGTALLVGSEGRGSRIWRVALPASGSPGGEPSGTPTSSSPSPDVAAGSGGGQDAESGSSGQAWWWLAGGALLAVTVTAGALLARRSGAG